MPSLDLNRAEAFLAKLPIRDRYTRRLIPFRLKYAQHKIMEGMKKQQAEHKPIRIILLKARRIGGSSFTDGIGLCHGMSHEGAIGLIVAHLFKSSKGLFEVPLNLTEKHLPGRMSLKEMIGTISSTKHEINFGAERTLSLATAGAVAGAGGRGSSFTFLHLSEAAYFPGEQPFTSLLPTVPYDPNTFIVIESTANGRVGPGASFFDYWTKAISGEIDYEPVFVPWHADPSYVRSEEGALDAPVDDYEKWLMTEFHCTKSQIAWWRATMETECKGTLSIMQQEYPASPEEAFVTSGDPAFEHLELSYVRELVKEPEWVGDIKCPAGTYTNPRFEPFASGDWAIWATPADGHHYYMGVDAARGMQIEEGDTEPSPEGDFAAAAIWDGDTGEQVAEYAKRVPPEKLAHLANAAGRFYNNAMVNIEITGNLGLWAQKVLRDDLRYPNIYRWRGGRDDHIGDHNRYHKRTALGWETTVRSREMMMDAFRAALRQGTCIPRSRRLLGQMEMATRKEGFRWEVVRGHDDILMANMVGWIAREQWGPSTMRQQMPRKGNTLSADNDNFTFPGMQLDPTYNGNAQLQLANHYHKIMSLTRQAERNKRLGSPLEGI